MKRTALFLVALVLMTAECCLAQVAYPYQACGLAVVEEDGRYGLMDRHGRMALAAEYDWVYPFVDGFAFIELDEKRGLVNQQGLIVVPPRWDYASEMDGADLLRVSCDDGKDGVLDKAGNVILPCEMDYVILRDCRYIEAGRGEMCAIYSLEGELIWEEEAERIHMEEDGSLLIEYSKEDSCLRYIDAEGKNYLLENLGTILRINLQDKTLTVEDDDQCRLISFSGETLAEAEAGLRLFGLGKDMQWFERNGKYGCVDKRWNEIISPIYYRAVPATESTAFVSVIETVSDHNGTYGSYILVDQRGNQVGKHKWRHVKMSGSDGLAWGVDEKGGGYRLIDCHTGEYVSENGWAAVHYFSDGIARVYWRGETFFVMENGERITEQAWADAYDFIGGYAFVQNDEGLWGTIDREGNVVMEPYLLKVRSIGRFWGDYGMAETDKYGYCYINEKGEILGPCKAEVWYYF